ncbi:MAG: tRNA (adenosine(37)-N6)-threonylcarbamoyltransferase complex dimerization subunit type 1 TsaB [Armatimonadetes bacterium]|nr:tRNA (adenosine(37)-N6)-threonylcarbamoyltransferase complex dimerization subunit type 1 TsaB [Armatimonadota bacterium]
MTIAFSSSSPIASVALIDGEGSVICERSEEARQNAGGVLLDLLDSLLDKAGRKLEEAELFAADLGPGSFTGVRVGVTVCKTMAYAGGARVVGADAFDLVDPRRPVAIPSRKGEHFLRLPGCGPAVVRDLPEGVVGYGAAFEAPRYPSAKAFAPLLATCVAKDPELMVPLYIAEPSISTPKDPRVKGGPVA